MELMKIEQLQILTYKTWDLHERVNEKINQNGFNFCTFCSNHGLYCVIAEGCMEEKMKMVAIRDALKDVHNILIHLQRVKSWQKKERDEAIARLEQSKKLLTEMINKCSDKERKHDVLEELIKFLGDEKNEFPWNFKGKMNGKHENVNGISRFLVNSTRFAFEFLVMFAGIYSTVQFCKNRQQIREGDSRMTGKNESLVSDLKNIHLDVLYGRG